MTESGDTSVYYASEHEVLGLSSVWDGIVRVDRKQEVRSKRQILTYSVQRESDLWVTEITLFVIKDFLYLRGKIGVQIQCNRSRRSNTHFD